MKKSISLFLVITVLILNISIFASASSAFPTAEYTKSLDYLSQVYNSKEASTGSIGGEWLAFSLARSSAFTDKNKTDYFTAVKTYLDSSPRLKATDYARFILALSSCSINASAFNGYDLCTPLTDFSIIKKQGVSAAAWCLVALDSNNYCAGSTIRNELIEYIVSSEIEGGGWNLSGSTADPDITAICISALSEYSDNANAVLCVNRGIEKLSSIQCENGGYVSYGTENSESCAQVIVALCSVGINPMTDTRFVKSGTSVVDAMLSYFTDNGFKHVITGELNQMATEQAVYALNALKRFENNETSLFDMGDAFTYIFLKGDVDMDNKVSVSDARLCLRCAIKLDSYSIGSDEFRACDFDEDGNVNVTDARLILRFAIGLN